MKLGFIFVFFLAPALGDDNDSPARKSNLPSYRLEPEPFDAKMGPKHTFTPAKKILAMREEQKRQKQSSTPDSVDPTEEATTDKPVDSAVMNYDVRITKVEEGGKCKQIMELTGNPKSTTKYIQDTFSYACLDEKLFHNTQDELLVGGRDQHFLLYGSLNNPDQLIEIRDGICKIKTYPSNDEGRSDGKKHIVEEELDHERYGRLIELLKKVEDGLVNKIRNEGNEKELSYIMNKFTKGVSGRFLGPNYLVESLTVERNGKDCTETITISGLQTSSTKSIKDIFKSECIKNRFIINTEDEVLVGDPDQNLVLYSNVGNPDQVVQIVKKERCRVKTYTSVGQITLPFAQDLLKGTISIKIDYFEEEECASVKQLINYIQEGLTSENGQNKNEDYKKKRMELNALAKKFKQENLPWVEKNLPWVQNFCTNISLPGLCKPQAKKLK